MSEKKNDLIGLRYYLDFKLVPSLFMREPGGILGMFENGKMHEFFTKVFNDLYAGHKTFTENDFVITKYEDAFSFVYYVNLPDEHEGSMVWCNAYGFCFVKTDTGLACQFFTVETSESETHMICGIEFPDKRLNFGRAYSTDKENAEKMLEIVKPKPQHVEL